MKASSNGNYMQRIKTFDRLERCIQMSLYELAECFDNGTISNQLVDEEQNFAVLLRISPSSHPFKKIYSLLQVAIRVKRFNRSVNKDLYKVEGAYGVYPSVDDPVTVFELGGEAEKYINEQVIPPLLGGVNGFIRRLVMKITGFHPSLDGVLISVKRI
jgi:hypothetical protein